jgi:hypothetical protein
MRNVSGKSCRENQNTHFVFSELFHTSRIFIVTMWKNIVTIGQAKHDIIRRMRLAFWVPKATETHSELTIFIDFH